MICIFVDSVYAYDFLSILEVKSKKLNSPTFLFDDCSKVIKMQLSEGRHEEILLSEEYLNLVAANGLVFDSVEKARYGNISANEVDRTNLIRHECKKKLQIRFFPNEPMKEMKT